MKKIIYIGFILIILLISGCDEDSVPEDVTEKTVIKWYARGDEPGIEEDCSFEVETTQNEHPMAKCELVSEDCHLEEECRKIKAPVASIAGCCKCTILCSGENLESREVLYNVVEVWVLECWGCGFDLMLVGKIYLDYTMEMDMKDSIIHTKLSNAKCFDGYEGKTEERKSETEEIDFIDYYLLTDKDIEDIKNCVSELEESGYCEGAVDCCEGYIDEKECDMVCVEEECVYG